MPDPASLFSLGGLVAMLGWLGLLIALFVKRARPFAQLAAGVVIPGLLAVAYVMLLLGGRDAFASGGGFGSIAEVRALFANDSALAAGWLHYLAFDLFVGAWIARDAARRGVPALLTLLCLPLTFLFGPAGFLLHLALRPLGRGQPRESAQ